MDGYTSEGKRRRVSFFGNTKKEVVDQVREFQTQRESNIAISREMTFQEWSEVWYSNYEEQVQPSTYCNYRYTLNILQAKFGKQKLASILPLNIERFLSELKKSYSASQITKCRSMLIQVFDGADANGLILRNPARKAMPPRKKRTVLTIPENESKKDAFSEEEVARILCNHHNTMMGNSICLMIGTGIREEEVVALMEADIPVDGSTLAINKAAQTVNGKSVLGPTKSAHSERVIPVPEDYREYAVYLREHGKHPFLWTRSDKNPLYSIRAFQRAYYKELETIPGVRRLSPHCCRHTYITRLQAKGVPMETIARLAGHSRIETTDKYLHTSDDVLQAAVSVLNSESSEKTR